MDVNKIENTVTYVQLFDKSIMSKEKLLLKPINFFLYYEKTKV